MSHQTQQLVFDALLALALAAACGALACSPGTRSAAGPEQTLAQFAADDLDQLITRDGVSVDREVSSDGAGSLRIETREPTTVRLFEAHGTDVDDALLFYRAKLRTESLDGRAYLEMWAHFPGKGEFFSRGLQSAVSGTTGWTSQETPFVLERGQTPDHVKLNLAVEGTGTVWIDEIVLAAAPRG